MTPRNFFDLTGQRALVTGGSRGLGQYMACALAEAGADIVVTSRNPDDCATTIEMIKAFGRQAEALPLDVRDKHSIDNLATTLRTSGKPLHILVNNAGCNIRKPIEELSWDDWNTVVETNLRGPFFVTQAVFPLMKNAQYGRIINIGSVTSVFGYAGLIPYSASRGGVLQMTRAMADEFGPSGVTVNCLAPGWFKTQQNQVLYDDPEWVEYLVDRIPVKRPGQPHDLDGAVIFLASPSSAYVTGQILLVDGGITTGSTRATVVKR